MTEDRKQAGVRGIASQGQPQAGHRVIITDRGALEVTGVLDVYSFEEHEIVLETTDGIMTVTGSNLHLGRLLVEKGEASASGKVDQIRYSLKRGNEGKESLFARLFR